METTVSEMTVGQLRQLISDVIDEKLHPLIDPDFGLELREEFVERLRQQQKSINNGEILIPLEEVMAKLGIEASEIEAFDDEIPSAVS